MQEIDLATQTMFAELLQRSLDADFDETFGTRGTFRRKKSKGKFYWNHQERIGSKIITKYVGPVTDKSITDRVNRFAQIKSNFKRRQEMVRALSAAGLPTPDPISGAVVETMWRAGFFRLRGVLVGTIAFQAYAGPLGVRLGGTGLRTQDVDFAQFWGISENIGESMPAPLTVLQGLDESFKQVPDTNDPFVSSQYRNKKGYRVDFLTPNRGSDEHAGKPAKMKALAGAGAQPLRHLDFLIFQPERSVLLYGGGVPVTIPRAERYAVHKLMVAVERQDQVKSGKDLHQAETLIEVLTAKRPIELASAWQIAFDTGPRWRAKLEAATERLSERAQKNLDFVLARAKTNRRRRARPKNRSQQG
jgi:hypothetical protein